MKSKQKNKQLFLKKNTIAHLNTSLMRLAMGGCAEDSATSCASCTETINNEPSKLSLGTCAENDSKITGKPILF